MVHIKMLLRRIPEDRCLEVFSDLENYCKVLRAKYSIRYNISMGPFYSTIEWEQTEGD